MSRKKIKNHLFNTLISFKKDKKASVVIMAALVFPVMIGLVGLGIDVGLWYKYQRQMQLASDAAAIGGAMEFLKSGTTFLQERAKADAVRNGYNTTNGSTITINNPPKSGTNTSNSQAVEVIITAPQTLYFSGLFLKTPPTVSTRAVAAQAQISCLTLLNKSAGSALSVTNGAQLTLSGCGVNVDSTSASSVVVSGAGNITASYLKTTGGVSLSGGGTITVPGGPATGASATNDPYASLQVPSYSGCNYTNFSTTGNQTVSPGVYCNGFSLTHSAKITMNPGTYIINQGTFSVAGNATLTGTGVTIILTSSTGSNYATISFSNGATVTLSAPTSGTFQGVLVYQDRNAPSAGAVNQFVGGSTQNLTGALYFPEQGVQFANGTTTNSCVDIISNTISISGAASVKECSATSGSSSNIALLE